MAGLAAGAGSILGGVLPAAAGRTLDAAAFILACASCTELVPSEVTTLMMLVPIRMRSPSASLVRVIFSPLTKLPLVEPRSSRKMSPSSTEILAWRRDTMSSTRTMSKATSQPLMTLTVKMSVWALMTLSWHTGKL